MPQTISDCIGLDWSELDEGAQSKATLAKGFGTLYRFGEKDYWVNPSGQIYQALTRSVGEILHQDHKDGPCIGDNLQLWCDRLGPIYEDAEDNLIFPFSIPGQTIFVEVATDERPSPSPYPMNPSYYIVKLAGCCRIEGDDATYRRQLYPIHEEHPPGMIVMRTTDSGNTGNDHSA